MEKIFRQNKKAFTFVEIMLVVALMSVIAVALFHTFSNGLKIWQKANGVVKEEDVSIFFDKIAQDLRGAIVYSGIPFEGEKTKLAFAALVVTRQDANKKPHENMDDIHQIGKVEYSFDEADQAVSRRQANYGQALKKRYGQSRTIVSSIHSMRFEYYLPKSGGYEISSELKGAVPAVIRIEINFGSEKEPRQMIKVINIPIGT